MTQHQRPQTYLPDPGMRPPQRSNLWLWVVLGAITLGVLGVGAWGLGLRGITPSTHTVEYSATADSAYGSGRTGMVTAQAPGGGSTQSTGPLPITGSYTQFHRGDFLYLSVQNQQGSGSVTCRITVDGVVVSENTSSGGYTIATCQGRMP